MDAIISKRILNHLAPYHGVIPTISLAVNSDMVWAKHIHKEQTE